MLKIILILFLFSNIVSIAQQQAFYVCKNPNGVVEEMAYTFNEKNLVKSILYSSSKAKKALELAIADQKTNYCEVKFPGDKSIYKLSISGKTVTCLNPDGTKQLFIKTNKNTDNNSGKVVIENLIKKENFKLILKLDNGKDLILKDKNRETDSVQTYEFNRFVEEINSYLVYIYYYEGRQYRLINKTNGEQMDVVGEIAVSPDKQRITSFNTDLIAGFSTNGFQIFKRDNNKFVKEFELLPETWGPTNAKWISNTEVEFIKNASVNNNVEEVGKIRFVKDKTWVEKK